MRTLLILLISLLRSVPALFRRREEQAIVELALRQQLAVYAQKRPRPKLSPLDRAFWVALSRLWPRWKNHLVIVHPETVVRWHRNGFRRYWRSISMPGPGRPPISEEIKALIVRMATENRWRARKIQAELMKLGIRVSLATVSRYVPKTKPDPTQQHRWMTFLRNHKDVICRNGLLRRPNRSIPSALRVVRDRPRETEDSALQRYREPIGSLGDSAAARNLPGRTGPSLPDLRQRRDILARCVFSSSIGRALPRVAAVGIRRIGLVKRGQVPADE